jgi:hypothetical protein
MLIKTIATAAFAAIFLNPFFVSADTYVDHYGRSFTYNKSVPYRAVTRVTNHHSFTNIYLDDGSVWRATGPFSCNEANTWFVNDPVIIYKCNSVFHPEDYYLYNERSGQCAYVNISCSSSIGDVTYLSLNTISYFDNLVSLCDGIGNLYYYQIATEDMYKLSSWSLNDCVILGWNKDKYTGSELYFPYILINTNTNESVIAEYIQYTNY